MKRTLVERVGLVIWGDTYTDAWKLRMARRIIAMVRRHDARKAGKR